jgi:hypothetical protein
MNASRSVCGPIGLPIPARRATLRTMRPAPWRSSRRPSAVRKIGPSQRSPTARSIARGERDGDDLAALTGDGQRPVTAFRAHCLDVGADGLRHPQPVQREQRYQGMLGCRTEPRGDQQRADLVAVQAGGVRLVVQPWPTDMYRRGMIQQFLFDGVAVDPAIVHRRRVTVARARPLASRSRAKHSMSARRTPNRRTSCSRHQAVNWRRSSVYASRVRPV